MHHHNLHHHHQHLARHPQAYIPQQEQVVPTKIDTQIAFTPETTPKLNCYYHPNLILTHFCKENQMPLCQDCTVILKEESQERGAPTDIVPLEQVLTEAFTGIADLSNKIQEEKESIRNEFVREVEEFDSSNALIAIQKAKEQAFELLTTYFDNLEKIAKEQIFSQKKVGIEQVKIFESEIDHQWHHFSSNLELLNSNECLPTLIHYYQGTFNAEYDRLRQDIGQSAQLFQNRQASVLDISQNIRYDQNSLSKLLADLHSFVSLKGTVPIEPANQNQRLNPYLPNQPRPLGGVIPQGLGQHRHPQGHPLHGGHHNYLHGHHRNNLSRQGRF